MREVWRAIPGFEGRYEASSQGRIRSASGRIKKPTPLPSGYLCVWLYSGGKRTVKNKLVSRLVLEAFVGPAPSQKHEAAHWDGVNSNNCLKNLRWVTHRENEADKNRHGTRFVRVGEAVGRSKLCVGDIHRMRDLRTAGCTHQQISEWIGTCLSNVAYVLQRRTWRHV